VHPAAGWLMASADGASADACVGARLLGAAPPGGRYDIVTRMTVGIFKNFGSNSPGMGFSVMRISLGSG
jgi:hypothetical protein